MRETCALTLGAAQQAGQYDDAGNMTADGVRSFLYDAWPSALRLRLEENRLAEVPIHDSDDGDGNEVVVAALSYDGLGRRIKEAIGNSADQNSTYLEFHDGQPFGGAQGERMIEVRDGSEDYGRVRGSPRTRRFSPAARGWAAAGPSPGRKAAGRIAARTFGPRAACGLAGPGSRASCGLPARPKGINCLLPAANCHAVIGLPSFAGTPGDDDPLLMSPTQDSRPVKVSGVPQPYGLCDFGHQGLQDNREFGWLDSRARPRNPRGPWPVRDHWGQHIDGMNLYHPLLSNPMSRLDPSGMWGKDVHLELTRELAIMAGIACPGTIASDCDLPDTDERRPGLLGMLDILALEFAPTGGIGQALAFWKARVIAEWHFPADPDGEVRAGSDAAAAKYKAAIGPEGNRVCNRKAFAEGLHVFQDSWSHQGKPYIAGIGHYRAVRFVPPTGYHFHYDENGQPESYGYDETGYWKRFDGTVRAALSESADVVDYWRQDVRDTAIRTYDALLEFKDACHCACPWSGRTGQAGVNSPWGYMPRYDYGADDPTAVRPTRGPTSSGSAMRREDVLTWLETHERYKGNNVAGR